MPNLSLTANEIIATLQRLLGEQYPRGEGNLGVLKEIIQNADDAGAEHLDLVLILGGLAGADNPLLRGPALACVNDGKFTKDDEHALGSMSRTSKAEDVAQVGRFGLGQKSVFHLAEAYFYLRYVYPHDPLVRWAANVIDPWSEPGFGDIEREDWDRFEQQDQRRLAKELCRLPHLAQRSWFALHLPLRKPEHSRGDGGLIDTYCPDVESLQRDLADMNGFSATLGQLGHLRQIDAWLIKQESAPRLLASIERRADSSGLSRPGRGHRAERGPLPTGDTEPREFRPVVDVRRGQEHVRALTIRGRELGADPTVVDTLRADPAWPKRTELREGRRHTIAEKAFGHGAVTIVPEGPATEGVLEISWAVYLPLGGRPERVPLRGSSLRWQILLHGYFFPDSGRRNLSWGDTLRQSSDSKPAHVVRARWNDMVRDHATLPCLLHAVRDLACATDAPSGDVEALAVALATSALWVRHRAVAARAHVLVWGPTSKGSAPKWRDAHETLLPLPRPSVGETTAAEAVIAELLRAEQLRGHTVVWDDGPRLCPRETWDPWPDQALARALGEGIETGLRAHDDAPRYLERCLATMASVGRISPDAVRDLLCRVLRAQIPLLRKETRANWQRVVEHCSPRHVLWSGTGVTLLYELAQTTKLEGAVVLPTELRPPGWEGNAVLSEGDALSILQFAATHKDRARGLAAEVVAAFGVARILAQEAMRTLPVFRVWSASQGGYDHVDAPQIEAARERGLAFMVIGSGHPMKAAQLLQLAIAPQGGDVFLSEKEVATAFDLPPWGDQSLSELFVRTKPALASPDALWDFAKAWVDGGKLVKRMQERTNTSPQLRLALRVALTGTYEALGDARLYCIAPDGASESLGMALLDAFERPWSLLRAAVIEMFTPSECADLGIAHLSGNAVVRLVRENEPLWDRIAALGEGERRELRRVLASEHDDALLKSIPLHDSSRPGRVVALGGPSVFLRASWPLPDSLGDLVDLVSSDDDVVIATAQGRCARPWTAEAQVSFCLDRPSPHLLAGEILDALAGALPGEAYERLVRQGLRDVPWLPTPRDGAVSPRAVYVLPAFVDEALFTLFSGRKRPYVTLRELGETVREHRARSRGGLFVSPESDGAEDLAEIVRSVREENPAVAILPRGSAIDPQAAVEAGRHASALLEDPGWAFAHAVSRWERLPSGDRRQLLDALRGELSSERLVWLLGRFDRVVEYQQVRELFEAYLEAARAQPDFASGILPKIKLRDAAGTWRSTSQLARNGSGLDPRFRLDARQAQLLRLDEPLRPAHVGGAPVTGTTQRVNLLAKESAVAVLREYLAPWRQRVSAHALGTIVAVMGDGERGAMRAFAEELLAGTGYSVASVRDRLLNMFAPGSDATTRIGADSATYVFAVVDPRGKTTVRSLTGSELEATVAETGFSTIFIERVPVPDEPAFVKLRRLSDVDSRPLNELNELLRASLEQFLREGMGVRLDGAEGFEAYWSSGIKHGAAQLEHVRSSVADRLPLYLDVHGARRLPQIAALLGSLERAEEKVREVESLEEDRRRANARSTPRSQSLESAKREFQEVKAQLVKLVETDAKVQLQMIEALRDKVKSHQYAVERVLFELFQNADDAAAQLAEMQRLPAAGPEVPLRTFRVEESSAPRRLTVQHWGRAINQYETGVRMVDGRARGYHRDLHRMLVLHLSEKGEGATGRFGLGFKSVYLVSDRPRITSAALSFEIVGGLLPRWVRSRQERVDAATTIELDLHANASAPHALGDFLDHGGLLTVFAQTIRRIEFVAGAPSVCSYAPQPLPAVPDAEVGSLRVSLRGEERRLLVVRGRTLVPTPAIVFMLSARGVDLLPARVPTVWCTAPTEERWNLGYAINGPFQLDVGRGQLARGNGENERVFERLGDLLGDALVALCRALEERFEETAERLGLEPPGCTPERARHEFWSSVFDRLAGPFTVTDAPSASLLAERRSFLDAMHAHKRGVSKVLRASRVLPTSLSGRYGVLTHVDEVRWVIHQELSPPTVFAHVAALPWCGRNMPPGTAAHAGVVSALDRLGCAPHSPQMLTASVLLELACPDEYVLTVEDARALAGLHREFDRANAASLDDFRRRGARWLWESQSGVKQPAKKLLLDHSFQDLVGAIRGDGRHLKDELLRAAFAPPEARLSSAFKGDPATVEFFLAVRGGVDANAKQLASWAASANSVEARDAAMHYMAAGELRDEFLSELRKQARLPAWCTVAALHTFAERKGLAWAMGSVEVALGLSEPTPLQGFPEDAFDDERPEAFAPGERWVRRSTRSPGDVLRAISAWWERAGPEQTSRYEAETYPTPWDRQEFAKSLRNKDRDAWSLLLVLGASQRIARQRASQHRGFVELLKQCGSPAWWSTVVGDRATVEPSKWIEFLDQWLGSRVDRDEYRQWLGLYPTLYQIHRFGHEYTDLFLLAEEWDRPTFKLVELLAPLANQRLSGFNAPPLAPALGIGAFWVLRELVRLRVIQGAHLHPECFVPRRRVRDVVMLLGAHEMADADRPADLGQWSRRIWEFLDDPTRLNQRATFDLSFDLPLYVIAHDGKASDVPTIQEFFE